ncbi:MAG: branched-chain amino acid ABC transporter permease [Deltaproteobacteria bacterium]|nr:branched-chain amino acid ABC transporter permease [Deltaproteobacteria bacterium]
MFFLIVQCCISGVLLGAVYILIAVGLTLIFGVMNISNFAHGTLLMMGMYVTYWLFTLLGLDPYLGAFISAAALFFLGALIQRYLFHYVMKAHHYTQIILAFGILIVLENFALFVWGADFRSVKVDYALSSIELGRFAISVPRLIAFGAAVSLTGLLYWMLKWTDLGLAIRATAQEERGARLMGINIGRIQIIVFGIGSACAGFAGALLTPFFYISPDVGNVFLMMAYVIVVLGGMGRFEGALVGGLIIGVVESLGAAFMPGSTKGFLIYIIFIVMLLFKPTGLFGRK